jgi:hypothetical protein
MRLLAILFVFIPSICFASGSGFGGSGFGGGVPVAASGAIDHAVVRVGNYAYSSPSLLVTVYNSSDELIATSESKTAVINTDMEFAFTAGPTLTVGQTYYVRIAQSNDIDYLSDGVGWSCNGIAITWPTVPDLYTGESGRNFGAPCVGVYDAANNLLLGQMSSCAGVSGLAGPQIWGSSTGYVR